MDKKKEGFLATFASALGVSESQLLEMAQAGDLSPDALAELAAKLTRKRASGDSEVARAEPIDTGKKA